MLPQPCQESRCNAMESRFDLSGNKRMMLWENQKQPSFLTNQRRADSPGGPAELDWLIEPKRTSEEFEALG